jgi:hypothetical protein
MATPTVFPGDVQIQGNLSVFGTKPEYTRSSLTQEDNARFKLLPTNWRVWDAMQTNLPGTAATDDLAIVGGTFGTGSPAIQTGDLKAAGSTTRYARCSFALPHTYVAGQSVTIRAHAGMVTTVASSAATVDFEVYRSDDEAGIGSDICATSAQSINSLTDANFDFTITPTTLNPGDTLDIRMAVLVNDAATATAVIGSIGSVEILLDVKG